MKSLIASDLLYLGSCQGYLVTLGSLRLLGLVVVLYLSPLS